MHIAVTKHQQIYAIVTDGRGSVLV